mmetsp:Transcript_16188/g.31670  ORF Transcript_16188/g.31670 Transcript_16188/m.31670 type:complete len:225 (-) Transcript_16188:1123-1797(-)
MPKLASTGGSGASDSDMRLRHSSRSQAEGAALNKTDAVAAATSSVNNADCTSATAGSSSHKGLLLLDKATLRPVWVGSFPSLLAGLACRLAGPPARPSWHVAPWRAAGWSQGRRCSTRRPARPLPRGVGTGAARGPRLSTAGTPQFTGDWQRCSKMLTFSATQPRGGDSFTTFLRALPQRRGDVAGTLAEACRYLGSDRARDGTGSVIAMGLGLGGDGAGLDDG